jgi:Domain of unknown function (DUF4411)
VAAAVYSIDSSSLMDWHGRYYPPDVFPELARKLETLVADGRRVAPALVQEEIDSIGPVSLKEWVANHSALMVPIADVLAETVSIQNQFAGLRDPRAEHDEADAYVIALARLRNGIVVTQETSGAEKRNPKRTHYIPDVCRELGIACIGLLGLMRREGWTF